MEVLNASVGFILLCGAMAIFFNRENTHYNDLSARIDLTNQHNTDLKQENSKLKERLEDLGKQMIDYQMRWKLSSEDVCSEIDKVQENCAALRRDHGLLNEALKKIEQKPITVSIIDARKATPQKKVKR